MSLGPSRFYLDDLKDIHEALIDFAKQQSREEANPTAEVPYVEIRALNATADEIEDLKDATRSELDHLSLILSDPKVRVDLWTQQAEIIAESDTSDVRKFVDVIKEFTDTRRSWTVPLWRVVRESSFLYLLLALTIIAPFTPKSWGITGGPEPLRRYLGLLIAFLAVMVAGATISRYMVRRDAVKIQAIWRKESRGLSQRSRRDIAVGLLAAVISALIIGIAGLWAGVFVR